MGARSRRRRLHRRDDRRAAGAGARRTLGCDRRDQRRGSAVPVRDRRCGYFLHGWFLNGERRIESTDAEANADTVVFRFGQYASRLELRINGESLAGKYYRARGEPLPVTATRAALTEAINSGNAPSIDGTWVVQAKSSKGETAWRFIAHQTGPRVEATILRVDGDTGTLSGGWQDGRFVLGHFSGARPLRLEVTPQADGTLLLSQNGQAALVAARADTARVATIGTPTDPAAHTRMKDPSEPFRFSFPDLDGRVVSNTDEKFRGKVLLVNISGSWCPNCHDEAPFLAALYRQYRGRGLGDRDAVVRRRRSTAQSRPVAGLQSHLRHRAHRAAAGRTRPVERKGCPRRRISTPSRRRFIVGRDGRVRAVHAGFPSPGSGEYYARAEHEVTELVERLLAEKESRQ